MPSLTRRGLLAGGAALLAASLVAVPAAPVSAAPARTAPYELVPRGPAADDVYPEGVGTFRDQYYVTSTTDGTVYRGDVDERRARPFLPGGEDGRTTAVGIKATREQLLIAGGGTGQFFAYERHSGDLMARYSNGGQAAGPTFINDVAVAPNGDAYITDSQRPVLYRVPANRLARPAQRTRKLPVFVDFTATDFTYDPAAFNANGLVVTPDGRYVLVVQSGTGDLYRISTDTGDVRQVEGVSIPAGDGLLLDDRNTLYVAQNRLGLVTRVELSRNYRSGSTASSVTDSTFRYPTTLARAKGRLLVVNSQFDVRSSGGEPERPFTVSSIRKP